MKKIIYKGEVVSSNVNDYSSLAGKPTFNNVEISGDKNTETYKVTQYCTQTQYNALKAARQLSPTTLYVIDDGDSPTYTATGVYNYDDLYNRPKINGVLLEGNSTLSELGVYSKSQIDNKISNLRLTDVVPTQPTTPVAGTMYYIGPNSEGAYVVKLYTDTGRWVDMGTTKNTIYNEGPGITLANNLISAKLDSDTMEFTADGINAKQMGGCSTTSAGTAGVVPGAAADQQNHLLGGDGTWKDFFSIIYPIGSIYISIDGTTPPLGVWSQLATGYTLWNTAAGGETAIEGSLPNITGKILENSGTGCGRKNSGNILEGAFDYGSENLRYSWGFESNYKGGSLLFDASKSNSVYGASAGANVVRPTSLAVTMFKRVA